MKGRWHVFIVMTLVPAFIVVGFAQWDVQTLEMEGRVGEFTSIQINSQGHLHITYYDESRGALKHAWREGSGWQTEVVDEGDVGWFTSLERRKSDETVWSVVCRCFPGFC